MDEIFSLEQQHLTQTYRILEHMRDALAEELEVHQRSSARDLQDMSEEIRLDFSTADDTIETLAAIETLNSVIDAYNQSHDFTLDKYRRTLLLLAQPYFAKVRLKMRPGKPARDIYIGSCGITDEKRNPIIVDWRSPVAETYYNQENGPTTYMVNGKPKQVTLELRRQFDIVRDVLRGYFDTTIAIQDSILLQALQSHHSEHLKAITATIQREQNEIIRHEDVPALLVDGIAGSGKTSVMLQRIAYLFYYQRETLSSEQVRLFSPNAIFSSYISMVLPSLGEANPHISTWQSFMEEMGLAERDPGVHTTLQRLEQAKAALHSLVISSNDFRTISVDGMQLIKTSQIQASFDKFARHPIGPRRAALVREDLHTKLERRLAKLARDADIQDAMLSLDLEDQVRIFGNPIAPDTDEETVQFAHRYLTHLYGSAHDIIDQDRWLRIDRIGMRMLNSEQLNACEWLYIRLLIAGGVQRSVRYVMVDEVQDYTAAQLSLLCAYFPEAHFLLLGDERQAIRENSSDFDTIRSIFGASHGEVQTCYLRTSYRSSPEITSLFLDVVGGVDGAKPASVRREGTPVTRMTCSDEADYVQCLTDICQQAAQDEGLTALLVENRARAHWLAKQLPELVQQVSTGAKLPATGVVLLDLPLAKGLEFDHVVIADAQESTYPVCELSRRKLYTAISRAMHKVTLVSEGAMTPLVTPSAKR